LHLNTFHDRLPRLSAHLSSDGGGVHALGLECPVATNATNIFSVQAENARGAAPRSVVHSSRVLALGVNSDVTLLSASDANRTGWISALVNAAGREC
jgi:hypothetical protein